jgi:hypothetical protein
MDVLLVAEILVGAFVFIVAAALIGTALRRRVIQREGGTFDCSLRDKPAEQGKGWALGLARYCTDTVEWYRVFSWSFRPRHVLSRRGLMVLSRRRPTGPESFALLSGSVIVECSVEGRVLELAMSEGALTGFLSWLEAAPPGQDVNVA